MGPAPLDGHADRPAVVSHSVAAPPLVFDDAFLDKVDLAALEDAALEAKALEAAAVKAAVAEKEKEVKASSTLDNGARASVAHHKYYGEREDPALTKMLHARSTSDTDLSTEGEKALAVKAAAVEAAPASAYIANGPRAQERAREARALVQASLEAEKRGERVKRRRRPPKLFSQDTPTDIEAADEDTEAPDEDTEAFDEDTEASDDDDDEDPPRRPHRRRCWCRHFR